MWNLPRPGMEPMCPAVLGRFLSSVPPGKSSGFYKTYIYLAVRVLVAAWRIFGCGIQTLNCSMWGLVPQAGIKPWPSALGAWSPSHWTTREVPVMTSNPLFNGLSVISRVLKIARST